LHCHSTFSDGVLTPIEVARRAHANGVQLWALTDHDELSGLGSARETALEAGMQFVTGVEVSVTWAGQTVHILGLDIDVTNKALNDGLARLRTARVERAQVVAGRFEAIGISGSYEGALRYAANPSLISRTHFARFLIERGHCKTMQAAFDQYLAENRPANVPMNWSTLEESVQWIVGAAGRAVIAHPGRYSYSAMQFDAFFDQFKQLGGAGIEVVSGSHGPADATRYAEVARRYGFLASCGSDFHSPAESRLDLGSVPPLPTDLRPIWHDWV